MVVGGMSIWRFVCHTLLYVCVCEVVFEGCDRC